MAKTPQEFTKNLKKGIITKEMLAEALYSVNKRAKNYRDRAYEYNGIARHYYGAGSMSTYADIAKEKKEAFYKMKDILLQMLTPKCIHTETQYHYKKVYDWDPAYDYYDEDEIERRGSYYDREEEEMVYFIVISEPVEKYYLFYDMGNHSFHTPIPSPDAYPDLEVVDIGSLITYGAECEGLMSVQFVKKIIALFESGNYELQLE